MKKKPEVIDRDSFLETDTQYEVVRPDDPDYPEQINLVMRIRPPSSTLLYDVFAHEYNKLPTGGTMEWAVPSYFFRSNIVRVFENRGLAPEEYTLESARDQRMRMQGIRLYLIRKIVGSSSCRQRKNKGKVPSELRTGYKLAASMALLHWMRSRAEKGKSIYRVPELESAEVATAKVVVVRTDREVTAIRRRLPMLDVGLPPAPPPNKKKDRQYLDKIRATPRQEKIQPEPAKPAGLSFSDGIEFG